MKRSLLPLLLVIATPAFSQSADALYQQACGPVEATVAPQSANSQPLPQLEPGKALVVFIQRDENFHLSTRAGLDGAWASTINRDAFLALSVAPGDHHLCVATQNFKHREADLLHLHVEAGKTYYLLVRGRYDYPGPTQLPHITMTIERADTDEALYLIASDIEASSKKKP